MKHSPLLRHLPEARAQSLAPDRARSRVAFAPAKLVTPSRLVRAKRYVAAALAVAAPLSLTACMGAYMPPPRPAIDELAPPAPPRPIAQPSPSASATAAPPLQEEIEVELEPSAPATRALRSARLAEAASPLRLSSLPQSPPNGSRCIGTTVQLVARAEWNIPQPLSRMWPASWRTRSARVTSTMPRPVAATSPS